MTNPKKNIFGEKNRFAIEIEQNSDSKKFCLRFWIDGNSIGDFKKGGSLDYIINDYFLLKKNIETLYEKKFDQMTDREIFDDIVFDLNIERSIEEENRLVERMKKFCLTFGDSQFNDLTFAIIY